MPNQILPQIMSTTHFKSDVFSLVKGKHENQRINRGFSENPLRWIWTQGNYTQARAVGTATVLLRLQAAAWQSKLLSSISESSCVNKIQCLISSGKTYRLQPWFDMCSSFKYTFRQDLMLNTTIWYSYAKYNTDVIFVSTQILLLRHFLRIQQKGQSKIMK